jgi:NADH:ubiquinone oxidoreductase subunit 6 (subunit J)
MTWLIWRQHRMQSAAASVMLAAFAILLAITGVTMANDYHNALSSCSQRGVDCSGLTLFRGDGAIIDLVNLTVAVPLLIGVFWGATSIGREYDSGTNVLAWTQSVSRRRWLAAKIATLLVTSLLAGTALSVMVTWWSKTLNLYHGNRFDPLEFDIQGLSPVAYTLFAAALGLLAGVAWRRVLPAIATTVGGFVAVRLSIENWVRPHYETAVTVLDPTVGKGTPNGAWSFNTDLIYKDQVVDGPVRVPTGCAGSGSRDAMTSCLQQHGFHFRSTFQPASRYWPFQWIEAGIFVGISAVLVAVAVYLVLRRDA